MSGISNLSCHLTNISNLKISEKIISPAIVLDLLKLISKSELLLITACQNNFNIEINKLRTNLFVTRILQ